MPYRGADDPTGCWSRHAPAGLANLAQAATFNATVDTLTIFDGSGRQVLVCGAASANPLEGECNVTGCNNGKEAVTSLIAGTTLTATFTANGQVGGDAGGGGKGRRSRARAGGTRTRGRSGGRAGARGRASGRHDGIRRARGAPHEARGCRGDRRCIRSQARSGRNHHDGRPARRRGEPDGREKLAEQAEVSAARLLEWVNNIDLMRVPGVGPQYSDLLEAAGVDSPAELALRNPTNLAVTVQEVVAARPGTVRRIPTEAEIAGWIEAARSLDKIVEH